MNEKEQTMRDKQIEEMAKIVHQEPHIGGLYGFGERIALRLYNAGYRKQREGEFEDRAEGQWLSYISPISLNGDVYYKCSVCGGHDPWQHTTRGRAKFCPECGARMRGENDDQR